MRCWFDAENDIYRNSNDGAADGVGNGGDGSEPGSSRKVQEELYIVVGKGRSLRDSDICKLP